MLILVTDVTLALAQNEGSEECVEGASAGIRAGSDQLPNGVLPWDLSSDRGGECSFPMAALEGLTRSTRCEGLESAWQGLVAARDGKHPSPNPWQVHKAGCVGSTALHEETGLQPGMLLLQTRSGNETWGLNMDSGKSKICSWPPGDAGELRVFSSSLSVKAREPGGPMV